MGKVKTKYVCNQCGYETYKWWGICPSCSSAGTMDEVSYEKASTSNGKKVDRIISDEDVEAIYLKDVEGKDYSRFSTGIFELDRVLGGGLVRGCLVLIGGDPGIGKSTILLQLAANISKDKKVLYVSAEESAQQIKLRSDRLFSKDNEVMILAQTNMELIETQIDKVNPDILILDSIQTVSSDYSDSAPGSVSQVKDIANRMMKISKSRGISSFIVGHATKEGSIAGPRVLEHLVDTVLYFEGEKFSSYRLIRAVKNRFGSTNELGVFEMTDKGLKEIENPSKALLSSSGDHSEGKCIVASVEGTRAMLIEIQSLVISSSFPSPRRTSTGIDLNRLNMLIAVIEKRIGIPIQNYDVYINFAGGIRINEPSIDLGVVLAICSSFYEKKVLEEMCVFGEVGLSGEVRSTSFQMQRVKEAEKIGYKRIMVPKSVYEDLKKEGELIKNKMEFISVNTVNEAVKLGLEKGGRKNG